MGVDFYTCSKCRDTYPDCGPHDRCSNGHGLCPSCMPDRDWNGYDDDKHDVDDGLKPEFCPVCQGGGTELERAQREITRLRALVKEAYEEGVSDGSCSGSVDVETRWNHSESKRKSEGEG